MRTQACAPGRRAAGLRVQRSAARHGASTDHRRFRSPSAQSRVPSPAARLLRARMRRTSVPPHPSPTCRARIHPTRLQRARRDDRSPCPPCGSTRSPARHSPIRREPALAYRRQDSRIPPSSTNCDALRASRAGRRDNRERNSRVRPRWRTRMMDNRPAAEASSSLQSSARMPAETNFRCRSACTPEFAIAVRRHFSRRGAQADAA